MLGSSLLAAALTLTAGGDAFMVQGFPQEYTPDKTLTEWIGSGDARLVNFETVVNDGTCRLAALKRTSAEFGTQFNLRTDGIIEVPLPPAR